jgi:hypothetical protein
LSASRTPHFLMSFESSCGSGLLCILVSKLSSYD